MFKRTLIERLEREHLLYCGTVGRTLLRSIYLDASREIKRLRTMLRKRK